MQLCAILTSNIYKQEILQVVWFYGEQNFDYQETVIIPLNHTHTFLANVYVMPLLISADLALKIKFPSATLSEHVTPVQNLQIPVHVSFV